MCVVPGDIWTCDTLSTESTLITKKYEAAELINPRNTSYLGYAQDPLELSEVIDSSYVIDDISDSTTEMTTPYSLIELEEADERYNITDKEDKNVPYHKKENYLYKYITNQRLVPLLLMQEYKNVVNNHYKCLNELISRLHIYKELSTAISGSSTVSTKNITTVNPTQTIQIFSTHNRKQNISLNYLVQNYVEENKLHNDKETEIDENNTSQTNNITIISTESPVELLINGLDSDNNIIKINDVPGNKQYFTVKNYKAIAYQLIPQTISIIPCTQNVRLPNRTDCTKYYTCDPKTASVVEYSCPVQTAFNTYIRICDIQGHKMCKNNKKSIQNGIFINNIQDRNIGYSENIMEEKLCQELGKIKDPTSDFHYYICHSMPDSEDINSIRMTCPNSLIFCQSKKVCTTKQLCRI